MQNNGGEIGDPSLSTPNSFSIPPSNCHNNNNAPSSSQQQQQGIVGQPIMTSVPSIMTNSNNNIPPLQAPQPPEGTQQFCLRWNSYPATIATQLASLRAAEDFVDVTLACDGRQLRAHKLVLSACSPYFMQLFKSTPCQHPVIFLRDVGFRQLVALLEFMYAGEVNVSQVELPALLRTAEALQVRGLADTTANNNNNNNTNCQPPQQKPAFSPLYGQMVGQPVMNSNIPSPAQIPLDQNGTVCPPAGNIPPVVQPLSTPPIVPTSAPSTSSSSTVPNSIAKRDRNSTSTEQTKTETNAQDEDSESNDSNEFDMLDSTEQSKPDSYMTDGEISGQLEDTGQVFPDDPLDPSECPFDMTESDMGNEPLTGVENQSDEESSEDVSDDDDGECKEFTYQSDDASYSQEGMGELDGNPNGESMAGPSGAGGPPGAEHLAGSGLKGEGGSGGGSGSARNRLSRSLWPPGIPYHGPQQCPYCPRVLSNVGNWRKHVLTMHFAREKVYKCRHCSSAFRTAEYLQKHYVRVHNYPQKMTRKKYAETP